MDPGTSPVQLPKQLEELLLDEKCLKEMAESCRRLGRPQAAESIAEMIRIHLDAHDSDRFHDGRRDRQPQIDRVEA